MFNLIRAIFFRALTDKVLVFLLFLVAVAWTTSAVLAATTTYTVKSYEVYGRYMDGDYELVQWTDASNFQGLDYYQFGDTFQWDTSWNSSDRVVMSSLSGNEQWYEDDAYYDTMNDAGRMFSVYGQRVYLDYVPIVPNPLPLPIILFLTAAFGFGWLRFLKNAS